MSTRALVCYKTEKSYVCKYSHYGAWEDYKRELKNGSFNWFFNSVNKGDSSEPFDGFYSDYDHCKRLGWDLETYIYSLTHIAPRVFDNINDVMKCADEMGCDMIYIKNKSTDMLEIYEYVDRERGYQPFICSVNYDIKPFIIENLDSYSKEDIFNEIQNAWDELDDNFNTPWDGSALYDKLHDLGLDINDVNEMTSKEELIAFCKKFNDAIPEIMKFIKEEL